METGRFLWQNNMEYGPQNAVARRAKEVIHPRPCPVKIGYALSVLNLGIIFKNRNELLNKNVNIKQHRYIYLLLNI